MYLKNLMVAFSLLLVLCPIVFGQVIDLGETTRSNDGQIAVAIESSDTNMAKLARRAFDLHGAYVVSTPANAAFTIRLEQAAPSSVLLTIGSGQPYVEQLRRTVLGRDIQDALLKASDLAVTATGQTIGLKGFFAGRLAFVGKQRGVSEVYTSDLLFRNVQPLTADRALVTGPSWSPDGTKLLYTTYHKSGFPDIYLLDLRTSQKLPIATYKGTNSGGVFSPDGRRIAMTLSGTGNSEIYVTDANGKNGRRLTTNKSLEASPSWSPDGQRLVYESDAAGKPQLYEISANGGAGRRLPTNISGVCSEPDWNPVYPNLIAFTAAVGSSYQIAVYDSKERKSEIVTQVSDAAVEPVWLNDGRHLVFTQRQNGRTRLMILDSVSRKVSALHNPNFGDASSATFVY